MKLLKPQRISKVVVTTPFFGASPTLSLSCYYLGWDDGWSRETLRRVPSDTCRNEKRINHLTSLYSQGIDDPNKGLADTLSYFLSCPALTRKSTDIHLEASKEVSMLPSIRRAWRVCRPDWETPPFRLETKQGRKDSISFFIFHHLAQMPRWMSSMNSFFVLLKVMNDVCTDGCVPTVFCFTFLPTI